MVAIRSWRSDDVPRLCELNAELGYPVGEVEMGRRLSLLGPTEMLVVAEIGGRVVGFVAARLDNHIGEGPAVELFSLVTASSSRRTGVGAALVEAVEAWAREQGRTVVRLRSNVVRAGAHAFYTAQGYEIVKRSTVFEKQIGTATD